MKNLLERRKYIRLNSVFPVTFQFILPDESKPKSYQGFISNVSFDGLCIEVSDLDARAQSCLSIPQVKLQLAINMPLSSQPSVAVAKVAWMKIAQKTFPERYLIGIHYENIDQESKKRIFAYAKKVRNMPRYVTACILALVIATVFSLSSEFKLRH